MFDSQFALETNLYDFYHYLCRSILAYIAATGHISFTDLQITNEHFLTL